MRPVYFRELLEFFRHHPSWVSVFGETADGGAIATNAPIPLPGLDGTGDTLDVSAATVDAVRAWFTSQGLATEAIDVKHAIEAAAFARGAVPYKYLPPALRAWEDA